MFQLVKAQEKDKELYRNVFNMYQNELSQYFDEFKELDENGYFDASTVEVYFENNEAVFPYIVMNEGHIIGILVLSKHPYVKQGCDYCIQEFFLIGNSRGKGIADGILHELFTMYPGKYCFVVLNQNLRAMKFWNRICNEASNKWNKTERENDTLFELSVGK